MIDCLIFWYRGQEQLLQYDRVDLAMFLKMLRLPSSWRYVAALLLYSGRREPPSLVLCGTWPQSLMAWKTTLMFLKSLRGFRKSFMDHISKSSKKGVEDKMVCEHFTTCVWIWELQEWYFQVSPSVQAGSWGSEFGTMLELQHILHMPPRRVITFFAGKLQKLTSKSKVHCQNQTVSRTPNKNYWTPHSCDEEKQLRLQSQHNFLPFSRKRAHLQVLPLCRS